jgi:hypothetical protein
MKENWLQSFKFFIKKHSKPLLIDVALLPLNENQIKITLRRSYINGVFFIKMSICWMHGQFESAIYTGQEGNLTHFEPQAPKKILNKKCFAFWMGINIYKRFFLRKKQVKMKQKRLQCSLIYFLAIWISNLYRPGGKSNPFRTTGTKENTKQKMLRLLNGY